MDYQKARSVRKSSLLSLIAERKFEEGQGLGSSIGGAISDKFKAKATGFKEALDPLNFVRKITGKGVVGDIAVTGLGRLFGRKDRDIQAFGGYGRKRNRGRKDPNFTTQGPGPARPLRTGDAISDILGKMYNFTLKKNEIDTKNLEIEKSFRQEQLDEDDRRHKELVEAIKSYTSGGKKGGDDKKKGNGGLMAIIAGILESLAAAWETIKGFAKRMIGIVGKALFKVGRTIYKVFEVIKNALEAVFEKIWGGVKSIVGAITEKLAKWFPKTSENVVKAMDKISDSAKSLFKVGTKAETAVGEKALEKGASKGIGKTLLKGIPILGLGAGLFFGAERAMAGDWVGAGLEVAGGAAGSIPFIGLPAEIGLGAAAAIHESNFDEAAAASPKASQGSATAVSPSPKTPQGSSTLSAPASSSTKPSDKTPSSPGSSSGGPMFSLPKLDTMIPSQLFEDDMESSSEPVVAVNNNVKNIGGKPDKIQSTSPIKQRNSDLTSYLRNISVPV